MDEDLILGLEEQLDNMVMTAIAKANEEGFGSLEVLDALERVVKCQRIALDLDPDPAEDP